MHEWLAATRPPWVLKPRSQAASVGVRTLVSPAEAWEAIAALGDASGDYLLEQFVEGAVYHVDAIVFDGAVRFAAVSRYGTPPLQVVHGGGIFVTRTLPESDPAVEPLREACTRVLGAFGLAAGVSHTEFIHAADGTWHFLETSARVGGAFIVEMIEAATGVNLWQEWARLEIAGPGGGYEVSPSLARHAGVVLSLARQEDPDTSAYTAPEIVHRIRKRHHAGLIVASEDAARIPPLLEELVQGFYRDFHASAPPPTSPIE